MIFHNARAFIQQRKKLQIDRDRCCGGTRRACHERLRVIDACLRERVRAARSRVNASNCGFQLSDSSPCFSIDPYDGAAHDDAVGECADLRHVLRAADAEADGERQIGDGAHALNQRRWPPQTRLAARP